MTGGPFFPSLTLAIFLSLPIFHGIPQKTRGSEVSNLQKTVSAIQMLNLPQAKGEGFKLPSQMGSVAFMDYVLKPEFSLSENTLNPPPPVRHFRLMQRDYLDHLPVISFEPQH